MGVAVVTSGTLSLLGEDFVRENDHALANQDVGACEGQTPGEGCACGIQLVFVFLTHDAASLGFDNNFDNNRDGADDQTQANSYGCAIDQAIFDSFHVAPTSSGR